MGNKNLHKELGELYKGLSYFIFQHVKNLKEWMQGFTLEWFKLIESYGWGWICPVRRGKSIKVNDTWTSIEDYIPTVGPTTKDQGNILFTERHKYSCRLVTTDQAPKRT